MNHWNNKKMIFLCSVMSIAISCNKSSESPAPLPVDPASPVKPSPKSGPVVQKQDNPQPGTKTPPTSPPSVQVDPPENEDEVNYAPKMSKYVECYNSFSNRVLESFDRYSSWCKKACEKNGPTGKEPYITYGLFSMQDPSNCVKNIAEANKMKPSLPGMEKAAEMYSKALADLYPVAKDAYNYYDQKNYKDDQAAKGRELHPKLLAGWLAFKNANHGLRVEIDKLEDEMDAKEVAFFEKQYGRTYPYLSKSIMLKAKAVLILAHQKSLKEIPLEAFTKALADYETIANEFLDHIDFTKHPDHKAQVDRITGAFLFNDAVKDFLVSAKALMRRVRDKQPFSVGEKSQLSAGSKMVEGTVENLLYEYNNLVDNSNRLDFSRYLK